MYGCMNVCIYVCMYVCMHACMHACLCVCLCMHVCRQVSKKASKQVSIFLRAKWPYPIQSPAKVAPARAVYVQLWKSPCQERPSDCAAFVHPKGNEQRVESAHSQLAFSRAVLPSTWYLGRVPAHHPELATLRLLELQQCREPLPVVHLNHWYYWHIEEALRGMLQSLSAGLLPMWLPHLAAVGTNVRCPHAPLHPAQRRQHWNRACGNCQADRGPWHNRK